MPALPTPADLDALRKVLGAKVEFTGEEWTDIATRWHVAEVDKGTFLCTPGQHERYLYLVIHGAIRIYYLKGAEDVTIAFSYNGYFAGEVNSFMGRRPADFYVEAITPCRMLRIGYDDLQDLYSRYKNMERWGRLAVEELMLGKNIRDIEMLAFTAEERYRRMMQQSPHVFQLFSQKHIASYLNMTPETLSRVKKKLMG